MIQKYIQQSLLLLLLMMVGVVSARVTVVASVPGVKWFVEEIGKEKVSVISLASGREDLHAVPARPSFLTKLRRADLLMLMGLDAEHAWLPVLAKKSRNSNVQDKQDDKDDRDKPGKLKLWLELI